MILIFFSSLFIYLWTISLSPSLLELPLSKPYIYIHVRVFLYLNHLSLIVPSISLALRLNHLSLSLCLKNIFLYLNSPSLNLGFQLNGRRPDGRFPFFFFVSLLLSFPSLSSLFAASLSPAAVILLPILSSVSGIPHPTSARLRQPPVPSLARATPRRGPVKPWTMPAKNRPEEVR